MNKQLLLALYDRSGLGAYMPVDYRGHELEVEKHMEKFARLIVRECYEHCRGQILDKEVADTNELTYNDAVGDCANGLLQHFGVNK